MSLLPLVQSAFIATTPCSLNAEATSGVSRTSGSFTLQVTHQLAVTSTKTSCPPEASDSARPRSKGTQAIRPAGLAAKDEPVAGPAPAAKAKLATAAPTAPRVASLG